MNLLTTAIRDGAVVLGKQILLLERDVAAQARADRVVVGVRPENWQFVSAGTGLTINITQVEDLGSTSFVYGTADRDGTSSSEIVVRTGSRSGLKSGQVVSIAAEAESVVFFDADSGQRLG
jgi:multiple sugar transport system ATP-binding protein